jgi:hypothetical protein
MAAARVRPARARHLTLQPVTRREQHGEGRAGLWQDLVAARDTHWKVGVASLMDHLGAAGFGVAADDTANTRGEHDEDPVP